MLIILNGVSSEDLD